MPEVQSRFAVLGANGWEVIEPSEGGAFGGVPVVSTGLTPLNLALSYAFPLASGTFGSSAPDTQVGTARYSWKALTRYEKGAILSNVGNLYTCTVAGTSAAATGPTHGSGTAAQTDCVNVLVEPNNPLDVVHSAVVPTKTRTADIVL